jgi:V/A-type H+-transporting ATPase subunit C
MDANEALAAKARAMYGKRLKTDDYEALLQKKTIGDIVVYLRSDTLFVNTLAGINEKAVHRGQLEVLLRMSLYDRLRRLLRYGGDHAGPFLVGACMNTEIDMILLCIRSLKNDDQSLRSQMITEMPLYMDQYMEVNLRKLAEVTSYEELYDELKDTTYGPIMRKYSGTSVEDIDLVALEYDLRRDYFHRMYKQASALASGETLAALQKLVRMQAELNNLAVIYRLKKYFHGSPSAIRQAILPVTSQFTQREMDQLIDEADADAVIDAIAKRYHHYVKNTRFTYIENFTDRVMRNVYYSSMETSPDAAVVLICYMHLARMEIRNVINIVEGVRYGVSNDRIRTLLVY